MRGREVMLTWRRASDCADRQCVEVAFGEDDSVYVRNSRNRNVMLKFTSAEWDAFVGGAKDGEFDDDRLT